MRMSNRTFIAFMCSLGLALCASGCSRRSPGPDRPQEPVEIPLTEPEVDASVPATKTPPRPSATPPPLEPSYPPGPLLFAGMVVVDRRDHDVPVQIYPMRLNGDALETGEAIERPRGDRGRLPAVAAQSPETLYVGRGTTVERHQPFTKGANRLTARVEEAPTALFGVGALCYVGFRGKVGMIDFSTAEPAASMIRTDLYAHKPVDYFVRLGSEHLVAVDDRVFPKYGVLFAWAPEGRVVYRFTSGLPAHANEGYTGSVAAGDVLVIIASFGVMRSSGNRLYRCRVADEAFDCRELEDSWPGHGLNLAVREDPAWPIRFVAGSQTSYWQGVGVIGQRIFIGAGRRGIIHLPLESDEARAIEVGGQCLDLFTAGDRVIALIREGPDQGMDTDGGQRVLVIYRWDEGGGRLETVARHPVPHELDYLLR